MQQQQANVAIPTRSEARQIIPVIREELAKAGVEDARVEEIPTGGVKAWTSVPAEVQQEVRNALFAHGVVIVPIRPGEWGFAVRR